MNEIITLEKFVSYINYIQFRLTLIDDDSGHKEIRAIIKKIRESFPIDEDGYCMVEHHCIFLNFKNNEIDLDYLSPEKLYEYLIIKHKK